MGVGISLTKDHFWLPASWVGRNVADCILPHLNGCAEASVRRRLEEMYAYPGAIALFEDADANELRILYDAVVRGYKSAKERGPSGWHMPECFPAFMKQFADLIRMVHADPRLLGFEHELPEDFVA